MLVWGDNVTVFQPDDIRQGVTNGFDSQFNQSALLYTEVLQLLSELGARQGFFSCKRKKNGNLKVNKRSKVFSSKQGFTKCPR